MTKILYQRMTQPVLAAGLFAEFSSEDKWHQAWTLPYDSRLLKAGAIVVIASGMMPMSPFALTQPETVMEAKWHQPYSTPVWQLKGIMPALQDFFKRTNAGPYTETVSVDKFSYPFSEPVRIKQGLVAALQPYHSELSQLTVFEAITMDKWFHEFERPLWKKPGLSYTLQMADTLVEAAPFNELVFVSDWFKEFSNPTWKHTNLAEPSPEQHFYEFDPEPFVSFGWYAHLSEPTRRRTRVATQLLLTRENYRRET